jgi:hypothetical protein
MGMTDDFRSIVARLRAWHFDIVEWPGCYGRSNGTSWRDGKPVGHVNHHYVCSLNPTQSYINSLVSQLAGGSTVNWFADVNGRGYLIGTGPMNHAGTGNSYVLNRTKQDQPNFGLANNAGDMSGNQSYSGTECQHPGDGTPWPSKMIDIMVAINAAEFMQWNYTANRAINHFAWTNRKIDMSWLGGPNSGNTAGQELVNRVKARMGGVLPPTPPAKDWFDMASLEDLKKAVREVLKEDDMVRYDATNQVTGKVETRNVSVVKGIGDGATYAGRAAHAAQKAQD